MMSSPDISAVALSDADDSIAPIITRQEEADDEKNKEEEEEEEGVANNNISLESITDGKNIRGIPATKFLEDIEVFAHSFDPPASSELLIGAYSDLYSKFKAYEQQLVQKQVTFQEKLPEIEKSISLVRYLKSKQDADEKVVTRYNLADTIYSKAEVDCSQGIVNLWLGANVMLEYTYDEALELLLSKQSRAQNDYKEVKEDLTFTRNQIITSEVNISRIYNWDVRRKREAKYVSK